ncbi:methylated-DNA--[protein]-cysteine S-methyltransferase [Polynucleobacter paludilacus]|uniref:methylated-DNA--[protein]-cysteine S-methyltransferase n=1 Tax=Polynucleobacter paludilacus TaxID=1855895 RepID=UPI001BFCEF3D|nr:methylated-DNA--[protein]-cysteine S-methyltransferase [Polynucleobacter paludilacus]QWD87189.1 methylated-DNA--[protein]-cysteine S-methyltransferase [Polynucleobacter paludilacus]
MVTSKSTADTEASHYCVIQAPFGRLGIWTEVVDGSLMLAKIDYLPIQSKLIPPRNLLAKEVQRQCLAYFKDPHFEFDIPLKPIGTAHQEKVWRNAQQISLGQTATYGEIANKIKSGPRAVGNACGANPFPLITPCHRVVSAQGLGGYMKEDSPGFYRAIKIWLLRHEGVL